MQWLWRKGEKTKIEVGEGMGSEKREEKRDKWKREEEMNEQGVCELGWSVKKGRKERRK